MQYQNVDSRKTYITMELDVKKKKRNKYKKKERKKDVYIVLTKMFLNDYLKIPLNITNNHH